MAITTFSKHNFTITENLSFITGGKQRISMKSAVRDEFP